MKDIKTFILEGNLDPFAQKFQQATKLKISLETTYTKDQGFDDDAQGLELPWKVYSFNHPKFDDYGLRLTIDKNGNFVIDYDSIQYVYNGTNWEYDDGYGDSPGIDKVPNVNNGEDLKNYNVRSLNKLIKGIDDGSY